jgi:F-type H+-transporting ATPase subunit b
VIKKTMLNLDISVLVIIILIWLLMNILNKIYFRPVGRVIRERETKVEKDSRELESTTLNIEEKTRSIETILNDSRKESMKMREELILKGEAIRQEIIRDAREKSKILFEKSIRELDEEIKIAEEKLTGQIDSFSQHIKETFL